MVSILKLDSIKSLTCSNKEISPDVKAALVRSFHKCPSAYMRPNTQAMFGLHESKNFSFMEYLLSRFHLIFWDSERLLSLTPSSLSILLIVQLVVSYFLAKALTDISSLWYSVAIVLGFKSVMSILYQKGGQSSNDYI